MAKKGYFSAKNVAWRDLPSGYTQVEYIESSGTQYINTGFIPNQDTRVVMEAEHSVTYEVSWLFGVRPVSGKNTVAFLAYRDKYRTDYHNTTSSYYDASITSMTHVDKNKNITTLNGTEVITQTYAAFDCQYPLFLLAINTAGTASGFASVELKKVQIYDNGTLIRDYVPCKNASGTAGLYDMVNGVFYGNAGTGSFLAGDEVHSDVAREPKKVYFSDNGVARLAKKAYYGDENGIARLWYVSGVPISTLAVGSSVFMNVNGVRTEFLVVHQGNPNTTMYDSSCDGTWLLTKNVYTSRAFDSSNNDYENSDIHSYLNNTFINVFDDNIKSIIKQVKIPYSAGSGSSSVVKSGSNGLSAKAFLLSCAEAGYESTDVPVEGDALDYFKGEPDSKRIALLNGSEAYWWLRTPVKKNTSAAYHVYPNIGSIGYYYKVSVSQGIRPALILLSDAKIDENFNVIG